MQIDITTAVDSLVDLVQIKRTISMQEAAKELGLPEHIVNEWATFLEDENILKIEYKFTTPYLVALKKKIDSNKSDMEIQKDVLTRKVETFLAGIKKYSIKHSIKIRTEQDVRALLKKKIFKKTTLTPDFVYAQQVVLIEELNQLLKKLLTMNPRSRSSLIKQSQKLSKWKDIFEDNLKRIKK